MPSTAQPVSDFLFDLVPDAADPDARLWSGVEQHDSPNPRFLHQVVEGDDEDRHQTDDPAAKPCEQAECSSLRHADFLGLTGTLDEGDATTKQLLPGTGEERVPALLPGGAQVGERLRRLCAECRGLLANHGGEEHEQHGKRTDDCDIHEQDRERPREVPPVERVDRGLNHGREHEG
jgi:hypothetical protein